MSIFLKNCPQCAQSQAVTSARCDCGYDFDSDDSEERPTIEVIAEDEKLYQEYLAARAAQAEEEVAIVRAGAHQNKANSAQLRKAEQALQAIRAELAEQNAKSEAAAAVARKARHGKSKLPNAQLKIAPAKPVALIPVSPPVMSAPNPPVAAAPKLQAARRAKFAKRPPVDQDSRPNQAFRAVQATKAENALKEATAAAEARLRALKTRQPKTESSSVSSKVPTSALTPAPRRASAPVPVPTPVRIEPARAVAAPKTVSRAAQQITPATKECPNCTAKVAEQLGRCRCGYSFPIGGPELPGIPLDAVTMSILSGESWSGGIGRRG